MTTGVLDRADGPGEEQRVDRSREPHRSARAAAPDDAVDRAQPQRIPVAIVGAGYIAGYHLEVLRELGIADVVGACDPNASRLDALRRRWDIPVGAATLHELLGQSRPAAVHVLVPPPYHFDVAREALEAGLHVLVEKPMALRVAECDTLIDIANRSGVSLRVNHNAIYDPAFRRLLDDVERRRLGRIEHVVSVQSLPLAQLESGEHDHWMFSHPANILFEQATHPLSQICELVGPVRDVIIARSGDMALKTGTIFHAVWQLTLTCERGTAQLLMSFGRAFAASTIQVIGQDATAYLDLLSNTYTLDRATKYLEPVDRAIRSLRAARTTARDGAAGLLRYALSTLRLQPRSDVYYRGMRDSIDAFYRSIRDEDRSLSPASAARDVVAACQQAAASCASHSGTRVVAAHGVAARAPMVLSSSIRPRPARTPALNGDILVLGGSGFIGRHVVAALAGAGHSVRIMTRRAVDSATDTDASVLVKGDIRRVDDITRAIEGCRSVIHLASGAPGSWAEYEELFVQGTRRVAEACLRSKVEQLLFASSIAVYNLARAGETITEDTPLDDDPRRTEYTRAKVACERVLSSMHRDRGLPVTIFRPGVVVGAGGNPAHLGVGFWPSATHCISWGVRTGAPLPFVLADDVAAAFAAAIGRRGLDGQSFNLVGDVRLSAEEYIDALRNASQRDVTLHRQAILKWYGVDLAKWAVKAMARKDNTFPSYRNFASWALRSSFDCDRAKRLLDWAPVADRERFIELGIRRAVHGSREP
jgi:predicted dehydrogenase/nucleoside-diphosphate-sugar epimerase